MMPWTGFQAKALNHVSKSFLLAGSNQAKQNVDYFCGSDFVMVRVAVARLKPAHRFPPLHGSFQASAWPGKLFLARTAHSCLSWRGPLLIPHRLFLVAGDLHEINSSGPAFRS